MDDLPTNEANPLKRTSRSTAMCGIATSARDHAGRDEQEKRRLGRTYTIDGSGDDRQRMDVNGFDQLRCIVFVGNVN